jgi:type IV secretion system protein VirB9
MDPRRFVIPPGAVLGAALLAAWSPLAANVADPAADTARPYVETEPVSIGRRAIAAANLEARAASRSDRFEGGVQVFAWSPGRVYEVWASPLRVTTLTLAEGETLISKAAGDTVRWQVAEARSGDLSGGRTHVLLKPLQRGLETNLVLTTDRRVYLITLKSGSPEAFNPAIAWDTPSPVAAPEPIEATPLSETGPVQPQGPLNARYAIEGRRAAWMPTAVFDDGRRTFIAFGPELEAAEAPALFVIAPDGQAQYVNYRQSGGLYIADRLFDRAELRIGERRPQVVRIRRLGEARR